jgi:hypothetical protein
MHNEISLFNIFSIERAIVGKTDDSLQIADFSHLDVKLRMGIYCSISSEVQFLLGGEHQIDSISTFPFKAKCSGYMSRKPVPRATL